MQNIVLRLIAAPAGVRGWEEQQKRAEGREWIGERVERGGGKRDVRGEKGGGGGGTSQEGEREGETESK